MKKITSIIAFLALGTAAVFAREVTISVGAGENWKGNHAPQFALWLEDTKGNYLQTLYVTGKASKKNWVFSPDEGRPESLPVWYHASSHESLKSGKNDKTSKNLDLDAVTSATPKGGIIFKAEIPEETCVIKAEFNTSFDYNETFTKKNSGVNGQPSVVYEANIPENEKEEIRLNFAGTGSIDGKDGKICRETEGLTTAKSIVKLTALVFSK